MTLTLLRAGERFRTSAPGRETWHAFSFGGHYDPRRTGFGLLLASNEDRLDPGGGYDPHEHRAVEIVTWVLDGLLRHDDDHGHSGDLGPGWVQSLSAGTGVSHSEHAGADQPAHLLQMWLTTDAPGQPPAYARCDVSGALAAGGWVALAGGRADDRPAVGIRQRSACLWVARLWTGLSLLLPSAPFTYLHVARGRAEVAGTSVLTAGDACLLTGIDRRSVTATVAAEVLVCQMEEPAAVSG